MKYFYEELLSNFKNSSALFYTYYGEEYSYQDCYRNMLKINSVLHRIRNKRIALYASKCFNAYCSIFSILLSGNVWVPFTPSHPAKRNLEMLKIVNPYIILIDGEVPELIMDYAERNNVDVQCLRDILEHDSKEEFKLGDFRKDDIAYIMFTSGSTGYPKGVPMAHGNYINFVENAMEILPFNKGEVFSDYHEYAFDISIFYLFCAVLTESAFAPILKDEEKLFPVDNIIRNKVTVWSSVPSVISQVKTLRPSQRIETKLEIMFLCGEPLRLDIFKYCYENMGIKHVFNFYGLTETGVENFYHECHPDDLKRFEIQGVVPIGKPLKGNDILIMENMELLLSGCQITPGYLEDAGKERFEVISETRWFHTGDIVEKIGGLYFCKGRLDSQVKISGHRVELMDIEAHLRRFECINDAVCFLNTSDNQRRLKAVIECTEVEKKDVSEYLKEYLPDYMIPREFILIKELPKNKNGKVDRIKVISLFNERT